MSRTSQILKAVSIGYGFQAVTAFTGLVLTPFMLGWLGIDSFGRWLVVLQMLTLLGLLDFGVIAVLPREVACASGKNDLRSVANVVRRAMWLVLLQMPAVSLIAAIVWFLLTHRKPELENPLALILITFVLQFPFRLPAAVLVGLQDLGFTGLLQAISWLLTTVISVVLVYMGWGLTALAIGWAIGQGVSCVMAWCRLRISFPEVGGGMGWPGWPALAAHLGPSFWTTLRQLAQFLANGAELLVLDWVAGPAVVVVYSCTVRLIAFVNTQPYLLVTAATPSVAQLQGTGDRERLWRACRALGLGMMLFSGALAIAILAITASFVPLWVGADKYAGPAVVLLAVTVMVARHTIFTFSQIVFALGYDSRLAITSVADGVVTVIATCAWVSAVGVIGVPLGSLTSLVLTNGIVGVLTLAAAEGVSPLKAVLWAVPWLVRFLLVATPIAIASFTEAAGRPTFAVAMLVSGLLTYCGLTLPLLGREPLRGYRSRFLAAVRKKVGLSISASN